MFCCENKYAEDQNQECYGLASVEHHIPITPSTRFELASVSKPFTAFAVLLLEQAGKLSLDDDIQLHLPELPDYRSPITVRDLLQHTSGLSDWVRIYPYAGLRASDQIKLEDLSAMVKRQRMLEFEPGTKWSYSNTNYALSRDRRPGHRPILRGVRGFSDGEPRSRRSSRLRQAYSAQPVDTTALTRNSRWTAPHLAN